MQLSEQHRANLRRIFADPGLVEAIQAVSDDATTDYKERAYRAAYGAQPNLVEITQNACKAAAFEAIVPLLKQEAEVVEETDVNED